MITVKPDVGDKIAALLNDLEVEMSDFRKQIERGDMQANTAYKQLLEECKPVIRAFRVQLFNAKAYSNEALTKLHASMDAFEAELSAGKHDNTRESIAHRLKQLQHHAAHLQHLLKGSKLDAAASVTLVFRLQRLLLKMLLLWLLYRWGRLAWQHAWTLQEKRWEAQMAQMQLRWHDWKEDAELVWKKISHETEALIGQLRARFTPEAEKQDTL